MQLLKLTFFLNFFYSTIKTSFALFLDSTSESPESNNGSFAISTVTSYAKTTTNITTQPLSSLLKLSSVSRLATIAASLPAEYEGSFSLVASRETGGDSSAVEANKDTLDPRGEGRTRYLDVKDVRGSIISGSVGWRESNDLVDNEDEEVMAWKEFLDVAISETEDAESLFEGLEALKGDGPDDVKGGLDVRAIDDLSESDWDQQRERGSSISFVTSSATNYLYFT